MSARENIKNYFQRLREKHKLSFINDTTYHEKWSFRVSSLNLLTLLALYTIIVIVGLTLLIRYTPLQRMFVEGDLYDNKHQIQENTEQIDSLYRQTESTQAYLNDLKIILSGGTFNDSIAHIPVDSLEGYTPDFSKDPADSVLRQKIEQEETGIPSVSGSESYAFFFAPVTGLISQSFNPATGHYGVDIVTAADDPIKACLEGFVILTGWTEADGKIVVVQHKDDFISIYKHCSALLKANGDQVQTGDPIAIVGDTGENTSGPHLHFELWKNGRPLDPQTLILFE